MPRPKRKATINKSYNDFIDDSIFEEHKPEATVPQKKTKTSNESTPAPAVANGTSKFHYNWQPTPTASDYFSSKLDLKDAYIDLSTQTLYCPNMEVIKKRRKDNEVFQIHKGDFIYMISEPPGEPYYIARVMGFKVKGGRAKCSESDPEDKENTHVEASGYRFQVQWFYRPRDISKFSNDSRLLYASMHTDTCPLVSFRGLVTVKHKYEIENNKNLPQGRKALSPASALEAYANEPNCFYFDKLFDRYMVKFYDVIPTEYLLNESKSDQCKNFLIALHKRFEFVFVETLRSKNFVNGFMNDIASCEKCGQWCSSPESVCCASCGRHFHMFCLDPPLLKKPSRGFSWSCAPCSKQYDIAHQKKRTLMLSHDNKLSNADQLSEDLESPDSAEESTDDTERNSVTKTSELPRYEKLATEFLNRDAETTFEQRRLKEEWCMRYLGIYSKLEDGVDVEDRSPYPRASTRLGAKHQATHLPDYCGHPIIYYDSEDKSSSAKQKKPKKTSVRSKKEDEFIPCLSIPREYKNVDPKDYPQWLQPRPKGYIERGTDDGEGRTCTLLWKPSEVDIEDNFHALDEYIESCSSVAESLKVLPTSPNFMDAILYEYMLHKGNSGKALTQVSKLTRAKLNEPTFSKEEIKRFENGVKKHGSELHPVQKMVKTQRTAMVVRYYYLWKKTELGKNIWGNFEGRMKRKDQKMLENHKDETQNGHPIDLLANQDDDSSYDMEKVMDLKRTFVCKHCATESSLQWFRVSGHNITSSKTTALCFRCARLWRRYAIVWEDPHEVERKCKSFGWKRKVESELIRDSQAILAEADPSNHPIPKAVPEKRKTVTPPPRVTSVNGPPETKARPPSTSNSKRKSSAPPPTPRKAAKVEKVANEEPTKPKPKRRKAEPKPSGETTKEKGNTLNKITKKKGTPSKGPKVVKKSETPDPSTFIKYPVYNANFEITELAIKSLESGLQDYQIGSIIKSFGMRNLLNMESYWGSSSHPQTLIKLESKATGRSCSLCLLESSPESKSIEDDFLQCQNCAVNVHSACAGLHVSKDSQPLSDEWLCEPCINKIKPVSCTDYACCLCSTHYSDGMEYLKLVKDNRKWCHLLCAIFGGESVRMEMNPPKRKRNDSSENSTLLDQITIKSVSELLFKNNVANCHICNQLGGSLIKCDAQQVHISCAQKTEGYSLGFSLENTEDAKVKVTLGLESGRLVPIAFSPTTIISSHYSLSELGKRATGPNIQRPLLQLFVEDVVRAGSVHNPVGPHTISNMLVAMQSSYKKSNRIEDIIWPQKVCSACSKSDSPIWWSAADAGKPEGTFCNVCYHRFSEESEEQELSDEEVDLEELINAPLDPRQYGLTSVDDVLGAFKPYLPRPT